MLKAVVVVVVVVVVVSFCFCCCCCRCCCCCCTTLGLICNVLAPHSHEIDPVSAAIRQPEQGTPALLKQCPRASIDRQCTLLLYQPLYLSEFDFIELKSLGNALLDWQRTWAAKKPASEVLDPTKSIQSDRLDTWVVPSIQLYCAGLDDDHRWTLAFLDAVIEHVWSPRLSIATGYFNCPPDYCDRLLRLGLPRASTESEDLPSKSSGFFQVITAAPRANGFFGARGVMGLVPVMYNEYLQDFLKRMQSSRSRGEICEFERPGWTFHAKGIWVEGKMYDNHDCHTVADVADCAEVSCEQISGPFLSVVGSSNFGFRSVERDLEAQLFVGTSNINLRATLATERNALLSQCVRQVGRLLLSDFLLLVTFFREEDFGMDHCDILIRGQTTVGMVPFRWICLE